MSNDESTWLEDHFPEWLAACDEALAAGSTVLPLDAHDPPAAVRERLAADVRWCRFVRRYWARAETEPLESAVVPAYRSLGRFEIRRELGRGTFGIVYLGFDPELRREVALKVPRPEALFTPELRARFRREARAAAALDHPNIVPVYDAGESEGVCFIASAYCRGITLAEWCRQQEEPIPPGTAAGLVALLAGAVGHAHERGILHRDLKPGNVLLVKEPGNLPVSLTALDSGNLVPRITDFGLAKSWGSALDTMEASASTVSGVIIGTPCYMAPEQAEGGGKRVGPPADVYALGAILYELLTGRPPYQADFPLETLTLVRSGKLTPPSSLRPGLPAELEQICLKCLEKDPANRYPSAGALAEDLQNFLVGPPKGSGARNVRAWSSRSQPRRVGIAVAVALAAVVGAAVAFAVFARAGRDSRSDGLAGVAAPLCAWSFTDGLLPPGATTAGTELQDRKPGGHFDGVVLRFREGVDAWLDVPFTVASHPHSRAWRDGRWMLSLVHHADGCAGGAGTAARASLTLNGREVWSAQPLEPAPAPGVPRWTTTRVEVTGLLSEGANVLHWAQPAPAATRYALKSYRIAWEPLVPPEPVQRPSFVWDFGRCDSQGTSGVAVEIFDAAKYKPTNKREGCFARFTRTGESWLELPFAFPADAIVGARGSWILTIYHKGTVFDETQKGFSPVLVTLNGAEVFRGPPAGEARFGPEEAWGVSQLDITKALRGGDNLLRWELVEGGTTHYWLKSCTITWKPAERE